MKSKTKRVLAFLCAVVLVITTVFGNWYVKQAEAADNVTPVTLDGFDNLTISAFEGDSSRTQGTTLTAGEYEAPYYFGYAASGLTNFDKKLVSLNVTFEGGGWQNSIMFGGNGTWVGFNMYPSADGSQLVVAKTWGSTITSSSTPTLSAETAGVDSFIGSELLLQMSFEYGEEVDGKADLTLGIYINGELYNDETFTIADCNMSACGARLALYPQTTGQNIVIGEEVTFPVVVGPVTLDGFDNLTISDFAGDSSRTQGTTLTAGEYEAPYYFGYAASGLTNFDKKLVSLNVTFEGGGWQNSIMFGGNGTWVGFNMYPSADGSQLVVAKTWGSTITSSSTPTLSATTAGVDSFIGNELLLQMSFEYGEEVDGKADLTLGIYINGKLYNNETFTIADCNMSACGARLALYPQTTGQNMIIGEEVEFPVAPEEPTEPEPVVLDGYKNLTIKDFQDAEDASVALTPGTGTSTGYKRYNTTECTNFDKVMLSMDITFAEGTYATRLDVAGGSEFAGWYSGLWIHPSNATGDELWIISEALDGNGFYGTTDARQSFVITPTEAGVTKFVGEEMLLQLAFDFGEEVNGKADLKLDVYINGNLAKSHTFTGCNMTKFGNYLNFVNGASITYDNVILSGTSDTPVGTGEPVELDGYKNLTIKNFHDADDPSVALTPGTGTSSGYKRYTTTECTNFDKVVLSMKVTFAEGGYATRLDVAGGSEFAGWYSGLWIHPSNAAGDELWIASVALDGNGFYGTTDARQSIVISPAEAGVTKFVDEEFILQLAFDFGEEVDGKADLKLDVYINGNLAKSHTFTDCNMTKFGNYLNFVNGAGITYENVVLSNTPDTPTTPDTPDVPDTPVGTGEPVELDGYDNLTIKNFEGLTPGTCYGAEGNGTYTGGNPAYDHTDFDNVVVSMKLTFTGGTYKTRMEFGSTGQWGFSLHPNADGTELQINNYSQMTDSVVLTSMTAAAAGVDSFLNEEFLLQMSFDYGEVVDGKRDVTVGVYINGQLYNNQPFTITGCDATKLGSCLGFYSLVKDANITYDDVILSNTPEVPEGPGDVDLSGYEEVTIKDFVDESGKVMEEKAYTCPDPTKGIFEGFSLAKHADFNKKVLSMNVMFKAGGYGARIDVTGSEKWKGLMVYPTATGEQLYVMATPGYCGVDSNQSLVVDATTAGIDSFIDTQFLMQLTFDFSEPVNGKTDLTVGVSINGKLCKSKTFTGCDATSFGNQMGLYRQADDATIIVGSVGAEFPEDPGHQPTGRYKKITFEQFGIADGTYSYVSGNMAVSGTASGRDTLDQTVICGDILYKGSDDSQIIWGGTSAWDGLRMFPKSDGTMQLVWYKGDTATPIATFDSETAGVQFVGEKYSIMLSSELVDADGDGNVNDIKIGIWFNDVLYNQEYIYAKDLGDQYGNYFSVYCASKADTVTLNSIPDLLAKKPNPNFEKITFQYFGLEDGTYKYDGTDSSTFSGKGIENLDQKVLCGDILLQGDGRISLMVGGKSIWYGLRFMTRDDGTILLIWVDEEGTPFIETFDSATAGTTLIGEWVNLMISTEIVDADGDGEKDDLEFGFWFNGVLYKDKYYTLIDKASGLGKCFGFDCAGEDTSVTVRSIPEYIKGFDYSMYGLTEDWKKTLLDTGFEVKTEVGKSRNPEPFTGDWTEIGKAICLFGTVTIVAIGACVFAILQRKKNHEV